MQNSVIYELSVFGGAGATGALLAFLYDMFRLKRRIVRTKSIIVHIEDILYWFCAAAILFMSSYVLSSGETRPYFYIGSFIGGLIYFGVLSKPVLWLLTIVINVIVWPINEIFKFLRPIFEVIWIHIRRVKGKIKSRFSSEAYRVRIDYHRLRNTFTKK